MIWDIYKLVLVLVLPKIDKRPDWTGLSSTSPNSSKLKRNFVWAACSTANGEDNEDPNNKNYQVSEADDEHKDDKESMTPQSEQEYQKMEVPASEFYENYNEESDRDNMAVMTVIPIKTIPDSIAASDVRGHLRKTTRTSRFDPQEG